MIFRFLDRFAYPSRIFRPSQVPTPSANHRCCCEKKSGMLLREALRETLRNSRMHVFRRGPLHHFPSDFSASSGRRNAPHDAGNSPIACGPSVVNRTDPTEGFTALHGRSAKRSLIGQHRRKPACHLRGSSYALVKITAGGKQARAFAAFSPPLDAEAVVGKPLITAKSTRFVQLMR